MKYASKYQVKFTDRFVAADYPLITVEIRSVKMKTDSFPELFKIEMLVTFLTRHAILQSCRRGNPTLADFIVSGQLFTGEIEALFDASLGNHIFRQQLEGYLEDELMIITSGHNY